MRVNLLILIILLFSIELIYAQENDGVVSFDLPIRNSLVFNRYAINPTFSFVREQHRYISFNNKREWIQFENAPETILASYSGRFAENIGAGIGVYQQNYGVATTYGGLLNFAYNVKFTQDSNLTFGLNIAAYKSGINTSNIVINFDDPSLQNIPENFLLTINPGINYGTKLLDFGVSINNLALYNFETSEMIEDDTKQSIQAHVMHTGYFDGRGFFKDTKFSGLIMSEFREDATIISGLASLMVPKGIWFQIGYNNRYGVSGGLGLNITKNIALEYNVEKAIGELVEFGSSHDITLAYRFIPRKRLDYNGEEEVSGLFSKKRKKPIVKASKEELAGIRERAAERRAKAELGKEDKEEADAKARLLAEQKAKEEAEARAKQLAEQKAQEEADAKAKLLAEQKAKEEAEARAKQLAEQKAQEEADAKAKLLAEQKANDELVTNPKDEIGKSMLSIAKEADDASLAQNELLKQYDNIIEIKNNDLKDLKEENDLSEQGITVQPRPFKSVTAENNKLNAIKIELDNTIEARSKKIEELRSLYEQRTRIKETELDEVSLFYKKKIKRLTEEQLKSVKVKEQLEAKLETIRVATEFEKRRRIKRAAYDNVQDRYAQDRAALQNIKRTTKLTDTPYSSEDFDFGEEQSGNIQILKNVKNTENGYYLIIAVHNNVSKRNEFVTKVVASGRTDVDYFYDVNTSKYYIYYDKFEDIGEANRAMASKGNRPYNTKMTLVKIE